jgi:hypothetical protein
MNADQTVQALKNFIHDIKRVSDLRYECSRMEMEAIKELLTNMRLDHPELLKEILSYSPLMDHGNR